MEDKLAFTTAAVASKWGCAIDDARMHALVQRAEAQTQGRLKAVPEEAESARAAAALAVVLLDGFQVRRRGPGWGRPRSQKPPGEWHELKLGVFSRPEQASRTAGGRGLLAEKVVVRGQGEALEWGRRLHWEAQRRGLGRAADTLALGDGAGWIGNPVADRWPRAHQLLDFYHGSEHLWALGRAVRGEERGGSLGGRRGCIGCLTGRKRRWLARWAACGLGAGRRGKPCDANRII